MARILLPPQHLGRRASTQNFGAETLSPETELCKSLNDVSHRLSF